MKHPEFSLKTIKEVRNSARAGLLRKLRANRGYKRLAELRNFNEGSLSLLEEQCWRYYVAAARSEAMGARAKASLSHLDRFVSSIGGGLWLSDATVESLDALGSEFNHLASKSRRGRPADPVAKSFRRNMKVFVPAAGVLQKTQRAASQHKIDEILTDISAVVFGRRVSVSSFTRMRKRDR